MGKGGSDAFGSLGGLGGGNDDLWKMMGMKKFSILDISDDAAEPAAETKADGTVVHVELACVPASDDGRSVRLDLRLTPSAA